MKLTIASFVIVSLGALCSLVVGQGNSNSGSGSSSSGGIPVISQAGGVLAYGSDAMSRYLAMDGPIQPALTAIGGLPMRATEQANRGITHISSGLANGARRISEAAGRNGDVRMPGMEAAESAMPASLASLGSGMQGAIRMKNQAIMGQAERAVESANRLRGMMQTGGHKMSSDMMSSMGNHMSGITDTLQKGGQRVSQQFKRSIEESMGRMDGMHKMGENMRNQAQNIGQTISSGLSGHVDNFRQTSQKVMSQLQSGHQQNQKAMGGLMSSMHGSMSGLGSGMQDSVSSLMGRVSGATQQVSGQLQKVAQIPMKLMQELGGMMKGGSGGGSSSSGGRGY